MGIFGSSVEAEKTKVDTKESDKKPEINLDEKDEKNELITPEDAGIEEPKKNEAKIEDTVRESVESSDTDDFDKETEEAIKNYEKAKQAFVELSAKLDEKETVIDSNIEELQAEMDKEKEKMNRIEKEINTERAKKEKIAADKQKLEDLAGGIVGKSELNVGDIK